jgi:transcriptional repressor NrdR
LIGVISTFPLLLHSFPLVFLLPTCQYIGMVCVYCGNETRVVNSRLQKRNNQVWRRRQCEACKAVFTTHEAIDASSTLLVDSRGSQAPFLADRLFIDIFETIKHRNDSYGAARELSSTVIQKLLKQPEKPLFSTGTISKTTAEVLKRFDKRAYLRYLSDHPSLQ